MVPGSRDLRALIDTASGAGLRPLARRQGQLRRRAGAGCRSGLRRGVRAQRAFLAAAVRHLTRMVGIRRSSASAPAFPRPAAPHEVAEAADHGAPVVYVD